MTHPKVIVVGSINMDLTVTTDRMPNQGETVLGKSFSTYPGGKGANQSVACARLGANTTMIGAVGHDIFGDEMLENLQKNEINIQYLDVVADVETGTASIILSEGDNRIIVNPGANFAVTKETVDKYEKVIAEHDVLLLQLEIPMEAVIKAAKIAKKSGTLVILNPAPYQEIPTDLLVLVDYITPNELEAEALLKQVANPSDVKKKLIVTKGKQGVAFFENDQEIVIPSFMVEAVDTTGAGDAFNGAFAYKIAASASKEEACRFANAAAALSITKLGAQAGLATETEVNHFLRQQEGDTQ